MAPCVAFIDEIEKALAGVGGSGDSGVATRLFGSILTWLSDHESDVFTIATSNDISKLPPEFTRALRWDALYFLDLPTAAEKDLIWNQYRRLYAIPESQARPDDTAYTGAEVRSCCRLAALLDVPLTQAAHHVVPVAVTAAEQVERLRSWASGRCLQRLGTRHLPPRRRASLEARSPCSTRRQQQLIDLHFPFHSPKARSFHAGAAGPFFRWRRFMSTLTVSDIPLDAGKPRPATAPYRRGRARHAALVGRPSRPHRPAESRKSALSTAADARFLTAGKKLVDVRHEAFRRLTSHQTRLEQLLAWHHACPTPSRACASSASPTSRASSTPWKASARS